MQVLPAMEVAEHYRDNIVYRDNLLNIIKLYQDIAFSIIAQPYRSLAFILPMLAYVNQCKLKHCLKLHTYNLVMVNNSSNN